MIALWPKWSVTSNQEDYKEWKSVDPSTGHTYTVVYNLIGRAGHADRHEVIAYHHYSDVRSYTNTYIYDVGFDEWLEAMGQCEHLKHHYPTYLVATIL